MSKLTLSRTLMAVAIATSVSSTYAANQTETVTGTLAQWKAWNAANKSPMPIPNASAGVDIFESSVVGQNKLTNYGSSFFNMSVTGSVTFDSETGVISALTMNQVSDVIGFYDVDGDSLTDDSYANAGAGGKLTFSGVQWSLQLTGNSASGGVPYLAQTAGSAIGCEAEVPQCQFTTDSVNLNPHDNGLSQSIFDFQGINAGFQTLPKLTASETAYGTNAKTWTMVPGVEDVPNIGTGLSVNLCSGVLTLAVASRTNAGVVTTNAANTPTFTLTVPNTICPTDTDNDGTPDVQDADDDDDGVRDLDELSCGTDTLNAASKPADLDSCAVNTDGDEAPDYRDAFPTNPAETLDTDIDGIGNNADTDDDDDKVPDATEVLKGSNPLIKDTDGDGLNDGSDPFPTNATTTVENETKYSQIKLSLPGCPKGSRVNSTALALLPSQYNLSFGDGLQMFGDYTQKGKKYSLKPTANSVALLQSDLTAWATTICGGNTTVTSVTFSKNELKVNKQQTQGVLTIKANVNATVKGKKTKGSYTVSASLPLASGAPQ